MKRSALAQCANLRAITRCAMKIILSFCTIFVTTLLASLLAIEVIGPHLNISSYIGKYEFRMQRPAPYSKSPYFSKEFIREQEEMSDKFHRLEGTNIIQALPGASGSLITHTGPLRTTTDRPKQYRHTVWVFGGSTVYGAEVPDEFTIPSFLQRMLNSDFPNRYKVFNLGANSVGVSQQTERLRSEEIRNGDVVIFYDGTNDMFQGLYLGQPKSVMLDVMRDHHQKQQKILNSFPLKHLKTVRSWIVSRWRENEPEHLSRLDQMKPLYGELKEILISKVREADRYSKSKGARFFHFFQPTLYSLDSQTEYVLNLKDQKGFIPKGLEASHITGHGLLSRVNGALLRENVLSTDLAGVLDGNAGQEEYYLDHCHVNEKANEIIAKAILEKVKQYLKK